MKKLFLSILCLTLVACSKDNEKPEMRGVDITQSDILGEWYSDGRYYQEDYKYNTNFLEFV